MKIVELDGYAVNPGDLSLEALKAYGELVVYERTAEQDVVSRAQDAEMLLSTKSISRQLSWRSCPDCAISV